VIVATEVVPGESVREEGATADREKDPRDTAEAEVEVEVDAGEGVEQNHDHVQGLGHDQ
jgi:hypothetical protein